MTIVRWLAGQAPKAPLTSVTPPTLSADVVAARTTFFAAVTQRGLNTFEGAAGAAGSPTFTYTGGTATYANTSGASQNGVVGALASPYSSGRYNMTAGVAVDPTTGVASGHWLEAAGTFTYSFSSPVSALAFYATDWADFNSTLVLQLYSGASLLYTDSAIANGVSNANGNLLWYAVASTVPFDRAVFVMTQTGSNTDVRGLDELMVGIYNPPPTDYWPGQAWPWPCGDVSI